MLPPDIVEEHIRQTKIKNGDLVGAVFGGAPSDDMTAITDPTCLATNTVQEVTSDEVNDDDDARKAAAEVKSKMKDQPTSTTDPQLEKTAEPKVVDSVSDHHGEDNVNTVPGKPVFRVNLKSNGCGATGRNGRKKNRKFLPPPLPRKIPPPPPPPRAATMGASTDEKSVKSMAPSLPSLDNMSLMSKSTVLPNMSMSGDVKSTEEDEEEQR